MKVAPTSRPCSPVGAYDADSQSDVFAGPEPGTQGQNTSLSSAPSPNVSRVLGQKRPRSHSDYEEPSKRARPKDIYRWPCESSSRGSGSDTKDDNFDDSVYEEVDHEDDNPDEDLSERDRVLNPNRQNPTAKRFACLLHKLNLLGHAKCEHFTLTSWQYTLQHIDRCHVLKSDYCPTCRKQFNGKTAEIDRNNHVQAGRCEDPGIRATGWLTLEEYRSLKRLGAGLCDEDKWKRAWVKLFPHLQVPQSPYLETHVEVLRRNAHHEAQRILGPWLANRGVQEDPASLIMDLVVAMFTIPAIATRRLSFGTVPVAPFQHPSHVPGPGPASALAPIDLWLTGSPSQISHSMPLPGHPLTFYPDPNLQPPLSLLSQTLLFQPQPVMAPAASSSHPFEASLLNSHVASRPFEPLEGSTLTAHEGFSTRMMSLEYPALLPSQQNGEGYGTSQAGPSRLSNTFLDPNDYNLFLEHSAGPDQKY